MSLRALASASLLYTAANLVPRLGALLLLPILTRFLGRADFGVVSLAGSGALLLSILLRLGLDQALLRLHYDVEGRVRADLYATLAAVTAGAAIAVLALVALGASLVVDSGTALLATIAAATGCLATFQYVPSVWLRATEQPGRFLALGLGSFGVTVAGTLTLVVALELGAAGALLAQLLGASVLAAAAVLVLLRLRPWSFRTELARRAASFGLPLLPHALGGWVLNVSDRWLLGLLLAGAAGAVLADIGVYSLGYQLGYAIGLVAVSFNAAWLPLFYRVGESDEGPAVLRRMLTVVVGVAVVLATAVATLAPELILVLAGDEWLAATDVAAVVAFASVANAVGLILTGVLTLRRRTRIVPLLTLVAAAVNLGANLLLIPRFGIMGAAWSTLIAYGAMAVLFWAVARRRYPLNADAARLTAMVAIGVGASLVPRLLGFAEPGWAAGTARLALLLVATAGVGVALRPALGELRSLLYADRSRPPAG